MMHGPKNIFKNGVVVLSLNQIALYRFSVCRHIFCCERDPLAVETNDPITRQTCLCLKCCHGNCATRHKWNSQMRNSFFAQL